MTARFSESRRKVEAIQWDGTPESEEAVAAFMNGAYSDSGNENDILISTEATGFMLVKQGNWIVRTPSKNVKVLTDEQFKAEYYIPGDELTDEERESDQAVAAETESMAVDLRNTVEHLNELCAKAEELGYVIRVYHITSHTISSEIKKL